MTEAESIESLEREWSPPDGFMFVLRQGLFDPFAYERVLALLRSLPELGEVVSRRLVSLLWYLPTFVSWQQERVMEAEGDLAALARAEVEIRNEVERLLGVP